MTQPTSWQTIDALLPQTQCTQCGYTGCRPYAEAMAAGTTSINRCVPGGDVVIAELAGLLGRAPLPMADGRAPGPELIALIDEDECIGCALCLKACPVDAIVGSAKLMHTVIASLCTGCELCVPPCPVDCIAMISPGDGNIASDATSAEREWRRLERLRARADEWRSRHARHLQRLARPAAKARRRDASSTPSADRATSARKLAVTAAIARAAARKGRRPQT